MLKKKCDEKYGDKYLVYKISVKELNGEATCVMKSSESQVKMLCRITSDPDGLFDEEYVFMDAKVA